MNIEDLIYIIYMSTILGLLIALTITAVTAGKRKQEPQPLTKTLLACYNCGHREERNYKQGDYVGKNEGACPKCGAPLTIHAIYNIYPRQDKKAKIPTPLRTSH